MQDPNTSPADLAYTYNMATFEMTADRVCHVAQVFLPKFTERSMDINGGDFKVFDGLIYMGSALPAIDPDTADRVLQRVLDTCPPMCAWLVAVAYNRVDSLLRLASNIANESMHMDFPKGAVRYLAFVRKWSSIMVVCECFPQFFHSCNLDVYWWLEEYFIENSAAGVELFRKIINEADISDCERLNDVVSTVMTGAVNHFKVLVNSPRQAVRNAVAANLKKFMDGLCTERMSGGTECVGSYQLTDCFMLAAQAGLFAAADPETGRKCMVMAAVANQPDLVLCLHHCGTLGCSDYSAMLGRNDVKAIGSMDPARVWGLGRDWYTVPFNEEAKETALGIKRFLAKQASTPLPLKKMCLQHLSKQMGWGHEREERIREADILDSLKDDLRFKGLEKVLRRQKQP